MTNNSTIGQVTDDVQVILGSKADLYQGEMPKVDLILALPRPQKLAKLLPIISCLGVRRLYIVGANKVEPAYFGKCNFRPLQYVSLLQFCCESNDFIVL